MIGARWRLLAQQEDFCVAKARAAEDASLFLSLPLDARPYSSLRWFVIVSSLFLAAVILATSARSRAQSLHRMVGRRQRSL